MKRLIRIRKVDDNGTAIDTFVDDYDQINVMEDGKIRLSDSTNGNIWAEYCLGKMEFTVTASGSFQCELGLSSAIQSEDEEFTHEHVHSTFPTKPSL